VKYGRKNHGCFDPVTHPLAIRIISPSAPWIRLGRRIVQRRPLRRTICSPSYLVRWYCVVLSSLTPSAETCTNRATPAD
jgi:hypothetical protein